MRYRFWSIAIATLAVVTLGRPVHAQSGYLSDDWLGYSGGTLTTYGSLADAMAGTNSIVSTTFPARDLSTYFVENNAAFSGGGYPPSAAIFLTNWFASADGLDDGSGNPNNTNAGFLQLYDADASTVASMSMGWTNVAMTQFEVSASGGPTITGCVDYSVQDCGRLWDGATSANGGSFLSWNFNLSLSGFAPATYNSTTGVYESNSEPTSASGTMSGIFYDATAKAWYDFSVGINNNSLDAMTDDPGDIPTAGGNAVTPEPATMSMMAFGLVGLAGAGMRRRRKTAV